MAGQTVLINGGRVIGFAAARVEAMFGRCVVVDHENRRDRYFPLVGPSGKRHE